MSDSEGVPVAALERRKGVAITASHLTRVVDGDRQVLSDVSLSIAPGELVAIVGGSGAGKTTLLDALAGVAPATSGSVWLDGVPLYENLRAFRSVLGYVPQDDIIHTELRLRQTLTYAARLRLPRGATGAEVEASVTSAMAALNLTEHADVTVAALSGGQRKRASIAVELLTGPHVFFLDEPTSGLDPATGLDLLGVLRELASSGSTVAFTTHAVQDLTYCDRIFFLAPGGMLAYQGSLVDALEHFQVDRVEEIYQKLLATNVVKLPQVDPPTNRDVSIPRERPIVGFWRQWAILVSRSAATLVRNRLTMAILLGAPVSIVVMFAILFQPGAFSPEHPSPSAMVMIVFWVTFGGFFFGITYGLLQVVAERPILRREYLSGERLGAYLLSKVAILLPLLFAVQVVMLAVLRTLDRLPAGGWATYASLALTLTLDSAAALMLGLLASAAVSNASQATLALPMLCFPAVLFSGAILPVHLMANAGQVISIVMPTRWAFEGFGVVLGVRGLLADSTSSLGAPLLASYGDAGSSVIGVYWVWLAAFTVVFFAGAWLVLARTVTRSTR